MLVEEEERLSMLAVMRCESMKLSEVATICDECVSYECEFTECNWNDDCAGESDKKEMSLELAMRKREKGWTFGGETGRGRAVDSAPPVFLLASPANAKDDLKGINENVVELFGKCERAVKFVLRGAQHSAREWVSRIFIGRNI